MSEKRHAFGKFHPRRAQNKITRRPPAPIAILAAGLLAVATQSAVLAQGNYQSRLVRIVVPNAPGSSGDIIARLIAPPRASSPEDFAVYIRSETVKWAKVVKSSGIQAE